jgi:lipoprotein-anchoring transpeptidase ErfK/SrfK
MRARTLLVVVATVTAASWAPAAATATPNLQSVSLVGPGAVTRWAYVLENAPVHDAPSAAAPVIARLTTSTPLGQPNLVSLLRQERDDQGHSWVLVRLPIRPNGTTGWVARAALDRFQTVRTHLIVDRASFTARLYRNGVEVFHARVGVGREGTPTPAGEFYVREELRGVSDSFYGPVAFGTSATSPTLTDWPGGGFIGIHGTNAPQLLPGAVSHGCIRMRNGDVLRLAKLMPLGTAVTIQ